MRVAFAAVWMLTLANAASDGGDWTIPVNVAGVTIMGVIGYLIRRSVRDIEDDIRATVSELRQVNGRLRIAELNIERIGAKAGVKMRRYEDEHNGDGI